MHGAPVVLLTGGLRGRQRRIDAVRGLKMPSLMRERQPAEVVHEIDPGIVLILGQLRQLFDPSFNTALVCQKIPPLVPELYKWIKRRSYCGQRPQSSIKFFKEKFAQ